MRILLAHNSLYFPSHGGGDKSNRLLMQALRERGHAVRVVARVERFGPDTDKALLQELAKRGVTPEREPDTGIRMNLQGVDVRVLTLTPLLRAYFTQQIADFDPDVILTSTDDPAHLLLDIALKAPRARVVYLVRAIIGTPFGPDTAMPSTAKAATLGRVDGMVAVSQSVAGYVRQFGGFACEHVPISLLEPGPAPALGHFDNRFVLLVNPCAVKGISIFLGLAARFPNTEFAAVPSWGTTPEDLASLRRHDNIAILAPSDDFDAILAQTRVVLVPSLWAEARSRVILEAMSRGVPVLASAVGGLAEAKLGVDYLLPVRPIVSYRASVDELMVPVGDVPEQNIDPWQEPLARLLTDRLHYQDLSAKSRSAALSYAAGLTVQPFEAYLEAVLRAPKRNWALEPDAKIARDWSPEKRRLLAARLKRAGTSPAKEAGKP